MSSAFCDNVFEKEDVSKILHWSPLGQDHFHPETLKFYFPFLNI